MGGQINFYKKSHIDLDRDNPELTVTDSVASDTGSTTLKFLRNRNNFSGWLTTGSTDAANTEILFDLKDFQDIDTIMLIKHNFKNFLIEYFDVGSGSFVTYENVTNNTLDTNIYKKTASINTNQIKLTINATIVVDADKSMRQFIITESFGVGEFEGWPQIKRPVASLNKKVDKVLGGKSRVVEKRGSFSVDLEVKFWVIDEDLNLVENIYYNREGVLMLLSGEDESQFKTTRVGYRNEDVFLVRPTNELSLPYDKGIYSNGIKVKMKLDEVIF